MFGIFAGLVEFERELIRERTKAGLAAARARGRKGGRKFELTKAQVRLAQAAMGNRDTKLSEELLSLDNVVLLPHLGSAIRETRVAMGMRVLENLKAFFAGEMTRDKVV